MSMTADALDARRVIADAAGPWTRDEKRPSWLQRAAREIGLPAGVIHAIWYRRRKRLVDHEYLALSRSAVTIQERRARLVTLHDEVRAARAGERLDVAGGEDQRPGGVDRAGTAG